MYILVIVDNFTKYVQLYGLKRATTRATLNRLEQYSRELGKPEAILTDNGTQFTASKWTDGLKILEIKPKFTAILNPCTNLAERTNRQLGNLFRVFVRERHSSWAKYLKVIECCLNQTFHDTISSTPFEAQFGKKPDREWTKYINKEIVTDQPIVTSQQIHLRIKQKRERQAEKLNRSRNLVEFKLGDLVMIKACRMSDAYNKIIAKFCDIYEGPYKICERVSPATYKVAYTESDKGVRGIFNVRQIKKYHVDTSSVS
jgi:hypothetical protein